MMQKCLVIDDTYFEKTGCKIEQIGKVFSHVHQKQILRFKALFCGYFDGKSFFVLDFSLHSEKGKNRKNPQGLSVRKLKERFSKKRTKSSHGNNRKQEGFSTKIEQAKAMIFRAKKKKIDFKYVLFDSWFVCFELIDFVRKLSKKNALFGDDKNEEYKIHLCQ
jgi:hypothetical protein